MSIVFPEGNWISSESPCPTSMKDTVISPPDGVPVDGSEVITGVVIMGVDGCGRLVSIIVEGCEGGELHPDTRSRKITKMVQNAGNFICC
jgi:hypothetical protein